MRKLRKILEHRTEEKQEEVENYTMLNFLILWHVDSLRSNDREISSYTTALAK
jgi:hypothetical protein